MSLIFKRFITFLLLVNIINFGFVFTPNNTQVYVEEYSNLTPSEISNLNYAGDQFILEMLEYLQHHPNIIAILTHGILKI